MVSIYWSMFLVLLIVLAHDVFVSVGLMYHVWGSISGVVIYFGVHVRVTIADDFPIFIC
jgi:hypothetical protein